MKRKAGFTVPPRSTQWIYTEAAAVRERLKKLIGSTPMVPLDQLYETLHLVLPDFRFEVCDHDEMGDDHGKTYPTKQLIKLREDVYEGMCAGNGRDRFTGAHELGHLFMHKEAAFARQAANPGLPIYFNSEWQADCFASAFLIDGQLLTQCRSIEEVQEMFGVSKSAAQARFNK